MSVGHGERRVPEPPPSRGWRTRETLALVASVLALSLASMILFASCLSAVNGYQQTEWQRDPTTWTLTTVVGVVLLLGGIGGLWLSGRKRRRSRPTPPRLDL